MALPNPIPDNPLRWDGWRNYNSENLYERLCLSFEANVSQEQVEENCRQLLVWWQKKLPLKNQPSNPVAQLLRAGLDEAPVCLVEARTELINPESRRRLDAKLHAIAAQAATEEFKKIIAFALIDNTLSHDAEARLIQAAVGLGLGEENALSALDAELLRLGGRRIQTAPPVPVVQSNVSLHAAGPSTGPRSGEATSPTDEFRRMLRLSRLCLDGEEMTDGQRDAMCNMGESLGLRGGEAEDIIDEYLEEASAMPAPGVRKVPLPSASPAKPAPSPIRPVSSALPTKVINTSPLARAQERQQYANFSTGSGLEMFLVTSGSFAMGSNAVDAASNEQPVSPVTIGCFYMARFPVTNIQYERFDPSHRSMRAPWADDNHPVVYVSSLDAERFCQWLFLREGRKFRLPSEAEWEYAARGPESRTFPWGDRFDSNRYANFADRRTNFPWRDANVDDGFAESAPVGSFPGGASPFGIEDLSGNVFEWCLDFLEPYKGKSSVNRRGPTQGSKRIYRGGSWKSRVNSLRAAARSFNAPTYSANDVGFRVIGECEG